MSKNALITCIAGPDGSCLAELLLDKDYAVYSLVRRLSTSDTSRIDHIPNSVELIDGDLTDRSSFNETMRTVLLDEVYNPVAQSYVGTSGTIRSIHEMLPNLGCTHA